MVDFGVNVRPTHAYKDIKTMAQTSETLGFDSGWVTDHLITGFSGKERADILETWTVLSALARDTTKLKLGQIVLCNSFRVPAVLAKMSSSLDVISNGRFVMGIGAGWFEREYLGYGLPFPSAAIRLAQLEEAVHIIKRFWTEDVVNFQGKYWTIVDGINYPKPIQKPRPKIWIGGSGDKLLGIVAREGDGCNFGYGFSLEQCLQRLEVLKNYCDTIGRRFEDVEKSLFTYIFTGKTQEEAEQKANAFKQTLPRDLPGIICGMPDQIAEAIGKRIDAGFTQYMLTFNYGNLQDSLDGARLFAEEVIPAL